MNICICICLRPWSTSTARVNNACAQHRYLAVNSRRGHRALRVASPVEHTHTRSPSTHASGALWTLQDRCYSGLVFASILFNREPSGYFLLLPKNATLACTSATCPNYPRTLTDTPPCRLPLYPVCCLNTSCKNQLYPTFPYLWHTVVVLAPTKRSGSTKPMKNRRYSLQWKSSLNKFLVWSASVT